jgi:hypothetical protein
MSLTWRKRVIRIRIEAEAFVSGPFAIHLGINSPGYTLTHVQSGWAIAHFPSEHQAKRFATSLPKVNWKFTSREEMPEATRRTIGELVRTLRTHGTANASPKAQEPAPEAKKEK